VWFFIGPQLVGQLVEFINESRSVHGLGWRIACSIENLLGFLEGLRFRPVESPVVPQPVGGFL
jgi:hypothetical protein